MPKYCCVTKCNGSAEKGFKMYRLPKVKNTEERARWVKAIPRDNIPDHPDTVVCSKHWPSDTPMIKIYGKLKSKDPPSIFHNIPPSMVPTPPAQPRSTSKALSSSRSIVPDQIEKFTEMDTIKSFEEIKSKFVVNQYTFNNRFSIFSYFMNNSVTIQSTELEQPSCIPSFVLSIREDFSYDSFHCGIPCIISSLSSNRIYKLRLCSSIEEALSSLSSMEKDNKKNILLQHISSMSPVHVGDKKYKLDIIIRSFEYFATSRSLYNRLRDDYEFPSIRTLTRLTSKVKNVDDVITMKNVLANIEERQKSFNILIDEVYVKPALLYHGGTVFGNAVNKPNSLANTVLAFFLVGQFGGPKFLFRMLPVVELDSKYLFEENEKVIDCIKQAGGNVTSIICDNKSEIFQILFLYS